MYCSELRESLSLVTSSYSLEDYSLYTGVPLKEILPMLRGDLSVPIQWYMAFYRACVQANSLQNNKY